MRDILRKKITEYILNQPDIMLAWFHGSFVKSPVWRDIDIAVYMHPEPDLLRLGEIQGELEDIAGKVVSSESKSDPEVRGPEVRPEMEQKVKVPAMRPEVDLSLMNRACETDPVFAQEVVNEGELVRNNVRFDDATLKNTLADFKLRCLKYFSDTERMRDMMDQAFRRRLKEGKFGRRNFTFDATRKA